MQEISRLTHDKYCHFFTSENLSLTVVIFYYKAEA